MHYWLSLGALIHIGGQKSLMAAALLIYCYGRRCFRFTQLANKKPDLKEEKSTDLSKNIWSLDYDRFLSPDNVGLITSSSK